MMEFAAVVVAVGFVVLVGYLVPTVLQLKRTVAQSEQVLAKLNSELPFLLKELRGTTENVHALTTQAKQGVDQASVLLKAVGDVGQTVNQVHGAIRGKSGTVVLKLASVLAGLKAASSAILQHGQKEGGKKNGK